MGLLGYKRGSIGKGSGREARAEEYVRFQDDDGTIRLRNLKPKHTLKGLGFLCCHRENQGVTYDDVSSNILRRWKRINQR